MSVLTAAGGLGGRRPLFENKMMSTAIHYSKDGYGLIAYRKQRQL